MHRIKRKFYAFHMTPTASGHMQAHTHWQTHTHTPTHAGGIYSYADLQCICYKMHSGIFEHVVTQLLLAPPDIWLHMTLVTDICSHAPFAPLLPLLPQWASLKLNPNVHSARAHLIREAKKSSACKLVKSVAGRTCHAADWRWQVQGGRWQVAGCRL